MTSVMQTKSVCGLVDPSYGTRDALVRGLNGYPDLRCPSSSLDVWPRAVLSQSRGMRVR
jgi:hypothetical protein